MRTFQAYVIPLYSVTLFKYLVRIMTESDYDWLAAVEKMQKARKCWVWLLGILVRERVNPRVLRVFFKAVVQALLF